MFEEVPIIIGFMVFSFAFSYFLLKYPPQPILMVIKALAAVGVIIHEICHIVMCFLTRSPVKKVSLIKKLDFENKSSEIGFYGQVQVYEDKVSFLQAFLVSFAPLFLCFWFFFWILQFLVNVNVNVDPLISILCIILMISLVLSAAPSISDLTIIPKAFSYDTEHSLYQILLVILSLLATWSIEVSVNFDFHEWHIYLIITGFYFVFKFGFRLIHNIFYSLYERKTKRIDIRNFQSKKIIHRRRKSWKGLR